LRAACANALQFAAADAVAMLLQLYWPDDKMWYLIEVYAINIRSRIAK